MDSNKKMYWKAGANIVLWITILLGCIVFLPKLISFFWPFVIGWILALIANPLVHFLESKLKIKRKASSALVIIFVLGILILLLYLLISKLVVEISNLISDMPNVLASWENEIRIIQENLNKHSSKTKFNFDIGKIWDNILPTIEGFIHKVLQSDSSMHAVGEFAKNLPSAIIGVIMMILSAYCFVAQKEYMGNVIRQVAPESAMKIYDLIVKSCKKAIGGYFKAQLQIEVWIYILLVIGLLLLKVNYAILVALLIAFLDFLPFFGAGIIMVPWAIMKFTSGNYKMAVALVIIWLLGQLVRQLIQPKYVGDNVGLSAIPTLFLLYIGYKLGSVIGMLIAVPIGIILVNMDDAGVFDSIKYSIKFLAKGLHDLCKIEPSEQEAKKQKSNIVFKAADEEALRDPLGSLVMDEIFETREKMQKRKEQRKETEGCEHKKHKSTKKEMKGNNE